MGSVPDSGAGPLRDVKVLELGTLIAGPVAAPVEGERNANSITPATMNKATALRLIKLRLITDLLIYLIVRANAGR